MTTLPLLLDSFGVGRPLPDGTIWTRAAFCRSLGIAPQILNPGRRDARAQQDLALALRWAMILPEREPDGWADHAEIRGRALDLLIVRRLARGERSMIDLPTLLIEWRICPSLVSASAVAEQLMEKAGDVLALAYARGGIEGLRAQVWEVIHG